MLDSTLEIAAFDMQPLNFFTPASFKQWLAPCPMLIMDMKLIVYKLTKKIGSATRNTIPVLPYCVLLKARATRQKSMDEVFHRRSAYDWSSVSNESAAFAGTNQNDGALHQLLSPNEKNTRNQRAFLSPLPQKRNIKIEEQQNSDAGVTAAHVSTVAWPLFGIRTSVQNLGPRNRESAARQRAVEEPAARSRAEGTGRPSDHPTIQAQPRIGERTERLFLTTVHRRRAPHLVLERARWRQVQGQRQIGSAATGKTFHTPVARPLRFQTLACLKRTLAGLRNGKCPRINNIRTPAPLPWVSCNTVLPRHDKNALRKGKSEEGGS